MNWIMDERKPDTNRDVLVCLRDDRGHEIFRIDWWDCRAEEPHWVYLGITPEYWQVVAWCDIEGPQVEVQP